MCAVAMMSMMSGTFVVSVAMTMAICSVISGSEVMLVVSNQSRVIVNPNDTAA